MTKEVLGGLSKIINAAVGAFLETGLEADGKNKKNKSIILEVEKGLYFAAMTKKKGNQSASAKLVGVSRGTLRTKLKQYFGTTHILCETGKCPICTYAASKRKKNDN